MEEKKFGLTSATIQKIKSVIQKNPGVERALIYGSRAKGNFKPGSDIDLTLIAPNLTFSDILKISQELDDLLLPFKIDLSLFHQINNPDLIEHIKRVGIDFNC